MMLGSRGTPLSVLSALIWLSCGGTSAPAASVSVTRARSEASAPPAQPVVEAELAMERAEPIVEAPPAPPEPPPPLVEPEPDVPGHTPEIENAAALSPFFAALADARAGRGIARVTHMGDSSIGGDGLPHALRTRFQAEYGDAGPGFVLLQRHSSSYFNRTVSLGNARPWQQGCFIIRRCQRSGHYGLGGVVVQSGGGAETTIRPLDGRQVSHAELWYSTQPDGGVLEFRFGDAEPVRIETAGEGIEDRWQVIELAPGEHSVRVGAGGRGRARAYGVVLENGGPGVVWDTLSMIGAFTNRILAHDEAHFRTQLQHRDPSMVVLSYGGNDLRRLVGHAVDEDGLSEETYQLAARVREALPDSGCLVLGINDHERSGLQVIRPADVDTVIRAQRRAAERAGCAFWSTVEAMGGAGSFARWRRRGLAAEDQKHLSQRGREIIGARLHAALVHAARMYER